MKDWIIQFIIFSIIIAVKFHLAIFFGLMGADHKTRKRKY